MKGYHEADNYIVWWYKFKSFIFQKEMQKNHDLINKNKIAANTWMFKNN